MIRNICLVNEHVPYNKIIEDLIVLLLFYLYYIMGQYSFYLSMYQFVPWLYVISFGFDADSYAS